MASNVLFVVLFLLVSLSLTSSSYSQSTTDAVSKNDEESYVVVATNDQESSIFVGEDTGRGRRLLARVPRSDVALNSVVHKSTSSKSSKKKPKITSSKSSKKKPKSTSSKSLKKKHKSKKHKNKTHKNKTRKSNKIGSLGVGALVGIIFAAILVIIMIIFVIYLLRQRHKTKQAPEQEKANGLSDIQTSKMEDHV